MAPVGMVRPELVKGLVKTMPVQTDSRLTDYRTAGIMKLDTWSKEDLNMPAQERSGTMVFKLNENKAYLP